MAQRTPTWVVLSVWALGLVLTAAVLTLGPIYLSSEAEMAARGEGAAAFEFFQPSEGWSREILAALHIVFLGTVLVLALFQASQRLASRMTGAVALLGLLEIGLAIGAVWVLGGKASFAPPQMTVVALGALLLLGGIGLNLESVARKVMSPKMPVALIFTVAVFVAVAAFGLIGMLSTRHYARIDYTRAGRYSLPDATVELLKKLDRKVRISTLFFLEKTADETLRREVTAILGEYERMSPNIEIDHLDLRREGDVKPAKALGRRLKGRGIKLQKNAVFFECTETGRAIAVPAYELLDAPSKQKSKLAGASEGAPAANEPQLRFRGDSAFHQALAIVASPRPITLYFVVGHGEKPNVVGPVGPLLPAKVRAETAKMFSTRLFQQGLKRRYFRIRMLDLDSALARGGIPSDCDVLVIAGPYYWLIAQSWRGAGLSPFSPKHADMVADYLERGGRAFVMIDPTGKHYARKIGPLLGVLKSYGVDVDVESIVFDEVIETQTGQLGRTIKQAKPSATIRANFVMKEYVRPGAGADAEPELHPSIATLAGRRIAAVQCAEIHTTKTRGMKPTPLLATSPRSWLQPLPGPDEEFKMATPSNRRPRTIAVAVEDAETGRPVMVVLGSSNMFIQQMIRFDKGARNEEFAVKSLAWLTGSTDLLAVRPKSTEKAYGETTGSEIRTIRFVSVLVLPSIFILAGALIWLGRRE